MSLEYFDGVSARTIFCMWTGTNPISQQRVHCLFTMVQNACCPVIMLKHSTLENWIMPNSPLHPAYEFLSETHKSDYLRCYLMYHFGGGYSDIKQTGKNWLPAFAELERSDADGAGYTEFHPSCVAISPTSDEVTLRSSYKRLIGNGAFIFKKRSSFTSEWYKRVSRVLDEKYEILSKNPAKHPQDVTGMTFDDGSVSSYPLRWAEIQGEIFHQLSYEMADKLLHVDIAPVMHGYR